MSQNKLNHLMQLLKDEGLDCTIIEANQEVFTPSLLLFQGLDSKKRERVTEITIDEQILPAQFEEIEKLDIQSGFFRLRVQTMVPIDFVPATAAQVASTINFLNGLIEIPGFYANEIENKIFYRQTQLISDHDLEKYLLIGLVGFHRLVLETFTDLLESVATGQMTYLQILEEIHKQTEVKRT